VSLDAAELRLDGNLLGPIPPRALTEMNGFYEALGDGGRDASLPARLTAALKARGAKHARVDVDRAVPYRLLSSIDVALGNARLEDAIVVTRGDAGSRRLEIHFGVTSRGGMVTFSSELDIGPDGYVLHFGEKRVAPDCRSAAQGKLPTVPLRDGAPDLRGLRACVDAMRATQTPMLWKEGTDLVVHATGTLSVGDVLETIDAARGPGGASYPVVILGL
jgi:hypothetical protein